MLPLNTLPHLLLVLAAVPCAFAGDRSAPVLPPFLPDVKTPAPVVSDALPASHLLRSRAHSTRAIQDPPIDFSRVWMDEPGDGRTWARARTYKASFGSEGATYIPFLGSQAPRNFPVRVSLDAVSTGGASIPLATGGVSHDGPVVTIDRGPIREIWHLSPDSAEQTFEIAQRPNVPGDVELRLSLESELTLRADGDGLALDGEHGGVRIGRATAIDADGRRLDLCSRLAGTTLTIELPADFAASARYPLVVDPTYSTHTLDGFGFETYAGDVAGGTFDGLFAATYTVIYTQSDTDVFTQDLYFGTPIPTTGDWVDATTLSWYDPHVAYNGVEDTYLTVASVQSFAPGGTEIWCRARRAQTPNEFPQQLVQNNAGGPVYFADVGGDRSSVGPSYFLCAWTRFYTTTDLDVHAQLLDPFGVRVGGVIYLENSGAIDSFPRVSESVGVMPSLYQNWNITWERDNVGDYDVQGARVRWDGVVTTPAFGIATSFLLSDNQAAPSTSLDGGNAPGIWMVVYQRNTADTDVWAKLLSGSSTLANVNLSALCGDTPGVSQGNPRVDSDGRRFAVTFAEYEPQFDQVDAYACTVAWAEGALRVDEARAPIETGPESTFWVEIAGGHDASNPTYRFYGLAYTPVINQTGTAMCGTYHEPLPYETFCSGDDSFGSCPCGNTGDFGAGCANSVTGGGVLTGGGYPLVSDDTFTLEASNLPGSAPCLFFQGTSDSAPGTAFGDGLRCAGGTTIRIASKTASGGIATYPESGDVPISVKGSIPIGGAQRRYQVWYRNAASFCTPASFNTTNGVRVRWLL